MQKTKPLDPRSYKAQSVPERMAIISAGVIMNLIFAVIFAAIAFLLGVKATPCILSGTLPGEIAWQADLQPGDEIVQINDRRGTPPDDELRWYDLNQAVMLSNPDKGVDFKIKRAGLDEPFWVTLKPERTGERLMPMIGAIGPQTTKLLDKTPVVPGWSAAKLGLKGGDRVLAVDGQPIGSNAEFQRLLAHKPNDMIQVQLERIKRDDEGKAIGDPETVTVDVPPNPRRTLGLVMKLGPITAIQKNSPAEQAGLRPGDQLVSVDGQPVGDPLTLPDRMRQKAGSEVQLGIERQANGGQGQPQTVSITPREPDWWEASRASTSPEAVTALGITYQVLPQIQAIQPGSPAEKAQLSGGGSVAHLAPGMEFVQVDLVPPPKDKNAKEKEKDADDDQPAPKSDPAKFGGPKGISWAYLNEDIQGLKPGTKVKFTLADERTVELAPVVWDDWNNSDRGFRFTAPEITLKADSLGKAVQMGVRETRDSVMQVYGFLRRIGTRISPLGLGGPVTIATAAGHEAGRGVAELLIFLTMLSANLAVINFLPIPILDGGHMVFLLAEAVLRRPVSERIQLAFTYAGLAFILSLMIFVFGLDISRLFSWI